MLDSKLVSVFKKYPDIIDTIHFSDQYTGPKPTEVSTQYTEPRSKETTTQHIEPVPTEVRI